MQRNIIMRSWIHIPIFEVDVLVCVAHDAVKAFNRYAPDFDSEPQDAFRAYAIGVYDHKAAMFFHVEHIGSDDIAHEVKHIVDFIMDWIGARERKRSAKAVREALSEPEAYLTGYIHKKVYALLRRRGIKLND